MQSLKILLSAYACAPNRGSEPGVGWRWAHEMAALNHEVWVITRRNNQAAIEQSFLKTPKPRQLHFIYYDLPSWARWWKRGQRGVHLYYLLWQLGAYRTAKRWHQETGFDAVHHITFGVIRQPSFMGNLGIPFVVGPLGGGEFAPVPLRKYYPFTAKFNDAVRDYANQLASMDPWLKKMYQQASCILLKTPQSMQWLATSFQHKACCLLEIGIDFNECLKLEKPTPPHATHCRILYVGRFIHWKGMDLGLRAVANMHARHIPLKLTMIGQGCASQAWHQLVTELNLDDHVTWIPWLNQEALLALYSNYDVLLFPSLHDSSGNVALEALANGLAVVCLNLGGPAQIVNHDCGRVVDVHALSADAVIHGLEMALTEIALDPALAHALSQGALKRAKSFSWQHAVSQVWGFDGMGYQATLNPTRKAQHHAQA